MQTEKEKNKMSAEATGGFAALKWLWAAVFIPVLKVIWNKLSDLEKKSYSKEETNNQIKLHVDPVKEEGRQTRKEIDKLSTSINVLSSVLTEFRVEVAKMSSRGDKE